jgi:hypothetical protein
VREQAAASPIASVRAGGHERAGPGDSSGAYALPGAEVCADHRHQRRAEAEHQRDQQVLEPDAHAVAREREGAEGPTSAVKSTTVRFVMTLLTRLGPPDTQDLREERSLEVERRREPDQAAPETRYANSTSAPAT